MRRKMLSKHKEVDLSNELKYRIVEIWIFNKGEENAIYWLL